MEARVTCICISELTLERARDLIIETRGIPRCGYICLRKAHGVIDKLALLNPDNWEEVRDRGIVLYQLKHYSAALTDLEAYLKNVPKAEDRQDVARLAQIIGRRLSKKKSGPSGPGEPKP